MQGLYTPFPDGAGSADTALRAIQRVTLLREFLGHVQPGTAESAHRDELEGLLADLEKRLWGGGASLGPLLAWRLRAVAEEVDAGEVGPEASKMIFTVTADLLALLKDERR